MPYKQPGANSLKKEKINEWSGTGIIVPRSGKLEDEIKFYPFEKTGGGVIHIVLKCEEAFGADNSGQPRISTTYVPVSVRANKNITIEQLKSVRSGMRVRVVGPLKAETYTKQSGEKVTTLVVNAFVFEVLQTSTMNNPYGQNQPGAVMQPGVAPLYMQGTYPGYNQPAYPGYPGQGGTPVFPGQPQPGYAQPGVAPVCPQGAYPGYAQPVYAQPQAGYGYSAPQEGAPIAAPQGGVPATAPYYRPPQGGGPAPAAAGAAPVEGVNIEIDDLPQG